MKLVKTSLFIAILTFAHRIFSSSDEMPKVLIAMVKNKTSHSLKLSDEFSPGVQVVFPLNYSEELNYEIQGSRNIDNPLDGEISERQSQYSIKAFRQNDNKVVDKMYLNIAFVNKNSLLIVHNNHTLKTDISSNTLDIRIDFIFTERTSGTVWTRTVKNLDGTLSHKTSTDFLDVHVIAKAKKQK